MSAGLRDALAGDADSDAYDAPLLRSFTEFREVFRHGVESLEIRNGRPESPTVSLTPEGLRTVDHLQRTTPPPRRVRIAGTVDAIRYSDRAFTLVLGSGEQVRGILAEGEPEVLAPYFGRVAVVGGMAQFRPSGALLRVDADRLEEGTEADLALWSDSPRPLLAGMDAAAARRPQGPRSGTGALIGTWPGDESEDELFALLEEMS